MVHGHEGQRMLHAHVARGVEPHAQADLEPRPHRHPHGLEVGGRHVGGRERLGDDGVDGADVCVPRHPGHDPAERLVDFVLPFFGLSEDHAVAADDSRGGVVAARLDPEHREYTFAPLHRRALLRRLDVTRRAPPVLGQALGLPDLLLSHGREQLPAVSGAAPRSGARIRYTLRLALRRDLVHFGAPTALLRGRARAAPAAQQRPDSPPRGQVPHPACRERRATAPRGDA
mmetsp:Transcript_18259/g.43286  ORF Transcript_18259/g.43286 Transcript_18259/m.43286 type:complete len:230 (+) Transcript_18259:902-1591(+)